MTFRRRDFLHIAAGAAALPLLAGAARAQTYPSRVITVIVPYPAGGPTDTIARILADRMGTALHQSVIVENVSGAGGSIGVGRVARAAPDGYTLSIGHVQTHVLNAAVMKLPYDVVNDFAPISLIADTPIWIISKAALPTNDFKSFLAWLKTENGKATAGTVGIGGPTEIAGLLFAKETGTQFQTARYTGGAPLLQDLLGGHIDFAFGQAATYLSYVREHQLKAYAVLQPKRWWAAPDVPTLDELGIDDIHASFWHGLWAPKGTPPAIIAKLNAAVREALADASVRQRLRNVGQEIWPAAEQTPQALAAKQKAEIAQWTPIVKAAGIKQE